MKLRDMKRRYYAESVTIQRGHARASRNAALSWTLRFWREHHWLRPWRTI